MNPENQGGNPAEQSNENRVREFLDITRQSGTEGVDMRMTAEEATNLIKEGKFSEAEEKLKWMADTAEEFYNRMRKVSDEFSEHLTK